jgi:signal transduction histidine kinase
MKLIQTIYYFLLLFLFSCNQVIDPNFNDSLVKISNPKIIYKLSGKWNFTTEDKLKNKKDNQWEKINVPGYWINSGYKDYNIGWYSIDFLLTEKFHDKDIALIIKNALNSHELYINGIKIGAMGEIISENEVIKNARPVVHHIPNSILKFGSPNNLSIRLADDVGGGGLIASPMLCEKELCDREFQLQTMLLGGIIFFFLFLGLYNILIYFGNKNDISYLYFGISVITFSFVTLGNERYTYNLTENYKIHFYIFHPSIYLCNIFVLLTINSFFDLKLSIISKILIFIFSSIFILSIFAGSNPEFRKIYNSLIINYQISFLHSIMGIKMIKNVLQARKQNKPGNFFILLGTLSLILSIFLLILYLIGNITRTFTNEGFFLMISCYAIAFALRYKSLREKLFQIELVNRNELEKKVQEKTKELIEINQNLSDSNNIKDKLFSIISHDLKSPLHSLEETLNLFKNKQMNKVSLMKYIKLVNNILETNKFLLENLLNWSMSHMKDSKLKIDLIDPRPILMEVYALHEQSAMSKKVRLRLNQISEVKCRADRNALRLILRNLVSNAIKFTPKNGIVILDIENDENKCKILVQDSGIGMNKDTMDSLFQYNRDNISLGTNQEGGSGLGLYICKEFLEKMEGSISVESTSGKGSRFQVILPRD